MGGRCEPNRRATARGERPATKAQTARKTQGLQATAPRAHPGATGGSTNPGESPSGIPNSGVPLLGDKNQKSAGGLLWVSPTPNIPGCPNASRLPAKTRPHGAGPPPHAQNLKTDHHPNPPTRRSPQKPPQPKTNQAPQPSPPSQPVLHRVGLNYAWPLDGSIHDGQLLEGRDE